MRKIIFEIEPKYDGLTVESYLLNVQGVSRRLLIKLKHTENGIKKNGIHIRTIDMVNIGDLLEISLEDKKVLSPNINLNVEICYEDEDVAVFNKPSGMPVHPSNLHHNDTLGNFFASIYPNLTFRPVNRLDKDTSGLCVVGKNAYAAKKLQESMEKTYFAVCCGELAGEGIITVPIGRMDKSIIKREVNINGDYASTKYRVLGNIKGYTFLEIKLLTGRTHQIRVHFSYIGYPLAGDDMYGGKMECFTRQVLHCGIVSFNQPVTGKKITVEKCEFKEKRNFMEKIKSFQVNHLSFGVGMYISRVDGDITTYDLRMTIPNGGVYLGTKAMHTIEHIFATFVRNSPHKDGIIYAGPMGCRTGFYLLTRGISGSDAIKLVRDSFKFISEFEGEIPGVSIEECGNYLEHDLEGAKKAVMGLLSRLDGYTAEMLDYNWHIAQV